MLILGLANVDIILNLPVKVNIKDYLDGVVDAKSVLLGSGLGL